MGVPLLTISYSLMLNNKYTANTVVGCVIVFNAAFGASWGPIPWMMNEVIPNNVRSKGAALLTATNWLFNFIVGEMTPILLDSIKWKTYLIPAASCLLSFFCVHFLFPETKGLTLEDMGSVFDDSSSIFLFHSQANNSNSYGTEDVSGAPVAPPRRISVSNVVGQAPSDSANELFRQSPAQIARNTSLLRPELDNTITGSAPQQAQTTPLVYPTKSTKSDIESLDIGPSDSNVPPQEIEPPSYDSIIQFKLAEQRKPGAFKKLYQKIWPGSQKDNEQQPLLP